MKTFRLFFNLTFVWILETVFCVEDKSCKNSEDTSENNYINKEQNNNKETRQSLLKDEKWMKFTEKINNVCNLFEEIKNMQIFSINDDLLEVASKLQEITQKSSQCLNYNIHDIDFEESVQLMNKFNELVEKKNKEDKIQLFLKTIKELILEIQDFEMLLPEVHNVFNKKKAESCAFDFILKIGEEVKNLSLKITEILKVYRNFFISSDKKLENCNERRQKDSISKIKNKDGSLSNEFKFLREDEFMDKSNPLRMDIYLSVSELNSYLDNEKKIFNLIKDKLNDISNFKETIDINLESIEKNLIKN